MGIRSRNPRFLQPLLAAAVLATIVAPVAIAGAKGLAASGSSAPTTTKRVKALKRKALALASRVSALEAKTEALQGRKVDVPTSLPPTGAAGGDLAATYPNPRIRGNTILSADVADESVGSAEIADNTIRSPNIKPGAILSSDIAEGAIGQAQLGNGIVGTAQLTGGVLTVRSGGNFIGSNASGSDQVSCPAGTRLIGGGALWQFGSVIGQTITRSVPSIANPATTWEVTGHNPVLGVGESGERIFAEALCLF